MVDTGKPILLYSDSFVKLQVQHLPENELPVIVAMLFLPDKNGRPMQVIIAG